MGKLPTILGVIGALAVSGFALRKRRMHRQSLATEGTSPIPGQFNTPHPNP